MAGKITDLTLYSNPDSVLDVIEIVDVTNNASKKINRNNFLKITGSPLGNTDTQTIQNKTVDNTNAITVKDGSFALNNTSDVTKVGVFSLSGNTTGTTRTYTLPNVTDTLVSLTATQSLTNKTITSPTITGGTLDNTTVTVDSVAGHTSSTSGTFYGISVASGIITSTGSIGSGANVTNGVQAAALATNAISLGYTQITANVTSLSSTSPAQITGLTSTVTIPAGGRKVLVNAYIPWVTGSTTLTVDITLWDGVVNSGTKIAQGTAQVSASAILPFNISAVVTPSAGSKTYNVGYDVSTGNITVNAGATSPAFILVETI